MDAWRPESPPVLLQPRTPGLEYFVEHHAGWLYILSNARGAEDYCLLRTPAPTAASAAAAVVESAIGATAALLQAPVAAAAAAAGRATGMLSSLDSAAAVASATAMGAPAQVRPAGGADSWQVMVPQRPGVAVTDLDIFHGRQVSRELLLLFYLCICYLGFESFPCTSAIPPPRGSALAISSVA